MARMSERASGGAWGGQDRVLQRLAEYVNMILQKYDIWRIEPFSFFLVPFQSFLAFLVVNIIFICAY